MTLRLYDTATRSVRDFVPLVPGKVSVYGCGLTVQGAPHVGHIRFGLVFDVLTRWLEYRGFEVTYCRNVTDIDDKILRKAAEQGVEYWRVASRYEREATAAYTLLGCRPPTVEPRATGHIPEMIAMTAELIERGHAYPANGDVYFDVRSFPEYGALSNQKLDDMLSADDADPKNAKRDPRDFTLWKGAKPGEPFWESPWGPGRPGWHLECSAMTHKYLGQAFDIHGGGIDLIFPHHENEIAQSKAAGDEFARYWLHNAWVTVKDAKMGKSLGNAMNVEEVARRHRPVVLRYYLASPHYRSMVEYSEEAIEEAAVAYGRIEQFVTRAIELAGLVEPSPEVPAEFAAAMDDDLGVPQAMAVLHNTVRAGNVALAAGDKEAAAQRLAETRAMLGVLGLDPLAEPWADETAGGAAADLRETVGKLVAVALEQRQAARSRKDFAAADAIRAQLGAAGVQIEDTPAGPRWSLG
ncbi:cysteine--tRNA ligase [Actinospica sp. MGRD01-02]|uniref:Cysteine--tRNA ligase n=1 Tax=Actinospica acidithermotolerans TaxID=2828514 RepID=A0A941IHM8_9ACTN|nr:cysteine--tRNA ligase [Actinospica acidithermotolerans]MBR7825882.1 cysteine--tRNA ligase [Actinospica acidithermotolerans]